MPPTIQSASKDRDRKRGGEKRSDLVCTVKYNNTLPDIPFDPKFITYPFDSTRFIQYKPTSLERTFKYDLLTEHDLGVTIDLINPETYKVVPNAYLEPEDERLLDEDSTSFGDQKRSRHNKMNVSWLRKTEYISTEYNRFIQKSDKSETKVGFNIRKGITDDHFYKDRDSQITAIDKTFSKAKEKISKHYSKPGVHPVEVLPVFPDFELWKHPFAQVIFDSDPAPKDRTGPALMDEMSQAMIRGAVDESGEQFVAYFLPTEETRNKRKRDEVEQQDYVQDDEYDYMLAREYQWTVKSKLTRGYEESYFMVFREDGCYYDELETRVRLSKRRKGAGTTVVKSRLVVKHRDQNDKEGRAQDVRMMMLEPPQDEEEEEEEEDEFPQNPNAEEFESLKGSDDEGRRSRSRSKSSSRSRSRSGSRSRSRSGSGSRSRSRSRSGSRSGSGSRSRSRSRSGSRSRSRSRSRSGSRSRSRSRSGSRSMSRSRSRSRSGSRSGSGRSRSRSHSRSKSRSRSRSRSGSRTPSRSRSRSVSRSGSEREDQGKKDEEEIFGSDSDSN